jgi:hypothetical protein
MGTGAFTIVFPQAAKFQKNIDYKNVISMNRAEFRLLGKAKIWWLPATMRVPKKI